MGLESACIRLLVPLLLSCVRFEGDIDDYHVYVQAFLRLVHGRALIFYASRGAFAITILLQYFGCSSTTGLSGLAAVIPQFLCFLVGFVLEIFQFVFFYHALFALPRVSTVGLPIQARLIRSIYCTFSFLLLFLI